MAMQTIPGGWDLPPVYPCNQAPATANKVTMSTANGRVAFIFAVSRTGNIASVVWRTATVTTGATIDVRLETVSAVNGDPTGTLVGTNTNASVVVAAADDNTIFTTTFTAAAAVTAGQLVALVFVNPGASFGDIQFAGLNWTANTGILPYHDANPSGSWTKGFGGQMTVACVYDDGVAVAPPGCMGPPTAITATAVNTGTTPDVYGLRFQLPFACRVEGAWLDADLDGDCDLLLVTSAYNQGAGTGILASVTLDASQRVGTTAGIFFVAFNAPVDLSASTNYRLIMVPTSATSVTVYDASYASLALLDACPAGAEFHLTTAKDPTADGDWTNYNSGTFRVPFMGVHIVGVDSGGASGGYSRARVVNG